MTEYKSRPRFYESGYIPPIQINYEEAMQPVIDRIAQGVDEQEMQTDEGLAKVLSEFSIGVLSNLVKQGDLAQPTRGWAEIKEAIRAKQLKIVKTECK